MKLWKAKKPEAPSIFPAEKIASLPKGSFFLAKNISPDRNGHLPGYYQTDVREIRRLLRRFTFPNRGKGIFRCGFDYELALFDAGRHPAELKVCFECKRLYVGKTGFAVEKEALLGLFQQHCRPFLQEKRVFESVEIGKAFIEQVRKKKEIIPDQRWLPTWFFFEGKFRFLVKKSAALDAPLPSQNKMTRLWVEKISQAFPKEVFYLQRQYISHWEGEVEYWYYLNCNKSLFEKMDWKEKNPVWMPFTTFEMDLYQTVP